MASSRRPRAAALALCVRTTTVRRRRWPCCWRDPRTKAELARGLDPDAAARASPDEPAGVPGRPDRPLLVPHTQRAAALAVHARGPRRAAACASPTSSSTRSTWRSTRSGASTACPRAFYRDWLRVAREEALHFQLLREHLQSLGHALRRLPGARRPVGDVREDRGTTCVRAHGAGAAHAGSARPRRAPPIQAKLRRRPATTRRRRDPGHDPARRDRPRGDRQPLVPLAVRAARARPGGHYAALAQAHGAPRLRGPFNLDARRAAGFAEDELLALVAP